MKPSKPYPDFPLTANGNGNGNGNGQWSKKIRGKVHYFGVWADWQAALNRYLAQRDYLHTGQVPPTEATTLGSLLNIFLEEKDQRRRSGEISQQTYNEYQRACDHIATLGTSRAVESLTPGDFGRLRTILGKRARPATHKKRLQVARMLFKLGAEHGYSLQYQRQLAAPSRVKIREYERGRGHLLYSAEQVRSLVGEAADDMRGMVLLGINCGFGPQDCFTLPTSAVDLAGAWHNYWRTKTQVERRCPLWPETVAALPPISGERVFNICSANSVSRRFKTLAERCGIPNYGFYTLKRTLETVATTCDVNQSVIDHAIGHARHDMARIYRQKIFDQQLLKFSDHVRNWYLGRITIE